jgi:hypothetical protein
MARKTKPKKKREAPFSFRMSQDLRRRLEAAASERKDGGISIAQEIERRLERSFEAQQQTDPQLRAITYLLSQAAFFVGEDWKTNRWLFEALQSATTLLLDKVKPGGEATPPQHTRELIAQMAPNFGELETPRPEAWGRFVADLVWRMLTMTPRPPVGIDAPSGSRLWAMPQARETLGVAFDGEAFMAADELLRMAKRQGGEK